MATAYYYILRDDKIIGRAGTRENAIDFVREQQENETERYYFGQAEYSIIEGCEQMFVKYPDEEKKQKRRTRK